MAPVPILLIAAHVALGAVAVAWPSVVFLQAAPTLVAVVFLALASRRVDRLVTITCYAGMCDVLWRMTKVGVPWEGSKYSLILGFGAVVVRFARRPSRATVPVVFLAALVPSTFLTISKVGWDGARDLFADTLAGPVALGLGVLAVRQLLVSHREMLGLLWAMTLPACSVAAIATIKTAQQPDINFQDASTSATSGGFGPNQVATTLGAGALCCLLIALGDHRVRTLVVSLAVGAWFVGVSVLTFSRGGFYSFVAAGLAILFAGLLSSGARARALGMAVVIPIVVVVLFGTLNTFTDGALMRRFDDTETTGRGDLANAEVELFSENLAMGVGPGMVQYERQLSEEHLAIQASHTEYTRLLAEHGLFGVVALVCLALMAISGYRMARTRWNRLIAAAFIVYPLVTMAHAATRIAAVSLLFGLSQMRLESEESIFGTNPTIVHRPIRFTLRAPPPSLSHAPE